MHTTTVRLPRTRRDIEVTELLLPSEYASAIYYGDFTDWTVGELDHLEALLNEHGVSVSDCVDVAHYGYAKAHDFGCLPADCSTFVFHTIRDTAL